MSVRLLRKKAAKTPKQGCESEGLAIVREKRADFSPLQHDGLTKPIKKILQNTNIINLKILIIHILYRLNV